jgi:radical SAM protein with 4Fe4S-binding SPASM domain
MKFTSSRKRRKSEPERKYFCTEPWTGIFSIESNHDVMFCPCYLQMRIGNVKEQSMQEIWNAQELIELRASFREGVLPKPCHGKTCPVVLGEEPGPPG